MTPRASTTCWTLACVTLLAACNGASIPNPLSSGGGSDVQVKEITNLSPRASVVLDKNCPDLVQPYRLADNVASMTMFSVKEGLKGVTGQLTSMLSGKSAAPTTGGSLSGSTKLAAKQLNWMPMTAEEMYAERQHNKRTDLLSRTSKMGKKYYPTADKMLADILASINEPYDYRFKLFIVKTDNRNALALPGGYLYLDQGLLDTPEHQRKAYFALAHEIGHVLQRHETKEMQSLVVDSFTVKEELVDTIQSARNNPGAVVDRIKLEKGQFTQHHVDQELQADSCAVKMLSHVYPDNQQLAATIDTFVKDLPQVRPVAPSGTSGGSVQAVSEEVYDIVNSPMMRHPNTRERTDNLQAIYREVTSTTTAAQ
ncbi:Beta-barrel assembly-enhancing protease [compost metagenome]